jgi:ribose transport system substrate-binding protein
MRRAFWGFALLAAALAAAGCGRAKSGKPVFAGVPKMLNNPVFELAHRGAKKAAAELGVELLWNAPVEGDALAQVGIVKNFTAQKVDGLFLSVNNAEMLRGAIDDAVQAGIPVVCFDSDAPQSKRLTCYGVDDAAAGGRAAELMVEKMGKQGEVAVLHGTQGAPNLELRIRGFTERMRQIAPGAKVLPPVFCNDNIQKAVDVVKAQITGNPGLTGFYLSGGWPLFATAPGPFAGATPGKLAVVAFDGLPEELEYVRQGWVHALTAQKCFEWGYESVKLLMEHRKGRRDFPPHTDSGFDVITKENVEAYAARTR